MKPQIDRWRAWRKSIPIFLSVKAACGENLTEVMKIRWELYRSVWRKIVFGLPSLQEGQSLGSPPFQKCWRITAGHTGPVLVSSGRAAVSKLITLAFNQINKQSGSCASLGNTQRDLKADYDPDSALFSKTVESLNKWAEQPTCPHSWTLQLGSTCFWSLSWQKVTEVCSMCDSCG